MSQVLQTAAVIPIDDRSRIVLFSDCHRGDGGAADDFVHNKAVYLHALAHYECEHFTYIELGDGDELWENSNFKSVAEAHPDVFARLRKFHVDQRFYMLYGNHDIERESIDIVRRTLGPLFDLAVLETRPMFAGLTVYEGLRLRYQQTGKKSGDLFLTHGHQGDWLNDRLWREGRFLVRYLWRPLQRLGIKDPTRTSKNLKKQTDVVSDILGWVKVNQQPIIMGHTHRESFADESELPYFNTGCCIYPDCITAIEIENGALSFVRWLQTKDDTGNLLFTRVVDAGPRPISKIVL